MNKTDITIEELEGELQELLLKIEELAQSVSDGEVDSYEGFMLTEKHRDRVVVLGHLLKERGIDITKQSV